MCVTFCWSTEVIIFACIPNTVSPFATTSITFLVGGLLLLMCFFPRIKKGLQQDGRKQLLRCLYLSALNGTFNTMFQFGLKYFDVTSGAFTLSLTVVLLPILLLAQRDQVDKRTWLSACIILVGVCIAMLNVLTVEQLPGLGIIVAGCAIRGHYIIKLNQYAREHDPLVLATLICLFGGVLFYLMWAIGQPTTFLAVPWSRTIIASLAIYSYFVIALTIPLNLFAQRRATPTESTIIYALEIALSVIWGSILPADLVTPVSLTPTIVIGVLCVIAGNLIELADDLPLLGGKKEAKA